MRRWRWAVALALGLLLRAPSVAEAHTALLSSSPAAGSRLTVAPARLRMVFSEPLEPSLARVELVFDDGRRSRLDVTSDSRDVYALVSPLPALRAGGYRVAWRVVSTDGHPVAGTIDFAVGGAALPAAPADDDTAPAWGPALWRAPLVVALLRALAVGSLMALAGLLTFVAMARRSRGASSRSSRLAARLAVSAAVLLALHLLAWIVNAAPDHQLASGTLDDVLATHVGRMELWRSALALLSAWALLLARREPLALALALAALAVSGATGHSAAIASAVTTPARAVHLLAAAAWLGGLLRLLTLDAGDVGDAMIEARRVSSVALAAVALVTLSGAVQTVLFLPDLRELARSPYGLVVCAKIGGLLALVCFGAFHRSRMLPRLARAASIDRFRATLRAEVVVMSLVVLLGGLLAYLPPPVHDSPVSTSSHHDMP